MSLVDKASGVAQSEPELEESAPLALEGSAPPDAAAEEPPLPLPAAPAAAAEPLADVRDRGLPGRTYTHIHARSVSVKVLALAASPFLPRYAEA